MKTLSQVLATMSPEQKTQLMQEQSSHMEAMGYPPKTIQAYLKIAPMLSETMRSLSNQSEMEMLKQAMFDQQMQHNWENILSQMGVNYL